MDPTSTQKTKEDLAFRAGEVRQAARDLNPTDPLAPAPGSAGPTLGERLREGYEEAKDSVTYAAKDLKEKMSLHPDTQDQYASTTTGAAYRDSSAPSTTTTTTTGYPSSTLGTEGEMHKPSLTERLRETYEDARETVMEKAHELKEKLAPSSDPVAVNTTATTGLGAPRVGGAHTDTADVPDASYGSGIRTSTTDVGTTHTLGERVRDSVRETAHNIKEKLESLTGMQGEEEEKLGAAATTTTPATPGGVPLSARTGATTNYETSSSNAPDYTYSSVGTSATHPDYAQKAKDAYHDAANTSADKYHEMKNTAADKYHEVKNTAADKYHETKNTASDYAQSAKNKASEYAEEAREKMEEWKHSSTTTAGAAAEERPAAGMQAQKYVTSTAPASVTTTTTVKQEPKA